MLKSYELKNFLCEIITEDSMYEGEKFFVQTDTLGNASRIAYALYPEEEITFRGIYTDFEAEMLGYDTF